MSLTQRFFVLVLMSLLPALGVVIYLHWELRQAREAEVVELVWRQTQQVNFELERVVEGISTLLIAVASAPSVQAMDEQGCSDYLRRMSAGLPQLGGLAVLGVDGSLHCVGDPAAARPNYSDRPYFQEALASGSFTTGSYSVSRMNSEAALLPFALPIRNDERVVVGVAVAGLSLSYLNEELKRWPIDEGGSVTIADADGVILARNPFPENFVGTRIPEPYQAWVNASAPGLSEVLSQDGTMRILSYIPASVSPVGLYVSSGVPEADVFSTVSQATTRSLVIIGIGTLAALLAAWAAGRYFVRRPVRELLALTEAWGSGTAPPHSPPQRAREFREISAALNRMGHALEERERVLRESEERLRTTIGAAPFPMMLHADDGTILEVSESWREQSGWRERIPDVASWLAVAMPDAPLSDKVRQLSAASPLQEERVVRTPSGQERVWQMGLVLLGHLPDGRKLRVMAAADVTERRRAVEHHQLLVRELNHRVKNTLAIVQAICLQTLKASPDPAEFGEKFARRLGSLAKTHDLLTENNWSGADLRVLLEAELAPIPSQDRIQLRGPPVRIPSEMAVSISLIFHELATNAVKYGALSVSEGRLDVAWTQSLGVLELVWRETGTVALPLPRHQGFGSRLVAQTVRGIGEGGIAFLDEGLCFTLRTAIPADEALAAVA